jgi:HK97 family phage prohead protease
MSERASFPAAELRFVAAEDRPGEIAGWAVRFNVTDSYRTSFDPAAFAGAPARLPLLWSHDPSSPIGSVTAIRQEAEGLRITGQLNLDVERAREARSLIASADVTGLSVGFRTIRDERRAGGVRHITRAELVEVSVVTFASVPGAGISSIRAPAHSRGNVAAFVAAVRRAAQTLEVK